MGLTQDPRDALGTLQRVDWSFPRIEAQRQPDVFDMRAHHWYPATYVPELPRGLIQALTPARARIHDPFGGIGTTFWQGLQTGRLPTQMELGEVPVRVARGVLQAVRSKTWTPPRLEHIRKQLDNPQTLHGNRGASGFDALKSNVGEMRDWFPASTMRELEAITTLVASTEATDNRGLYEVALSSSLMGLAAQRKGYGYIADNVKPPLRDAHASKSAIRVFLQRLQSLLAGVQVLRRTIPESARDFVEAHSPTELLAQGDSTREQPPLPGLDAVITSPPYPGMVDYSLSQRLTSLLLGLRCEDSLEAEIGARRHRRRKTMIDDYLASMSSVLEITSGAMNPGAYLVLVLPDYPARDEVRGDAMARLAAMPDELGLRPIQTIRRELPANRRHHQSGWGTMNFERIHVYRR